MATKLERACNRVRNRCLTEFFSGYYLIHPGTLDPDAAQRTPRIIISMTSFTPRLGKLYLAVNSIFNQSLKPDKVILYLGDDVDKNALPKTLTDLTARGLELRFVDNLRSHKKYFYAMQEYPDDLIILIDDDMIYPRHMIEKLYASYLAHPDCVSAMRAHEIVYDADGLPQIYRNWKKESRRCDTPSFDLFFTTGFGTLFPPHCLDSRVFDAETIKEKCFSADDVWLNCMCRLKGTRIVTVQATSSERKFRTISGTQQVALTHGNLNDSGNDRCVKNMIDLYGVGVL